MKTRSKTLSTLKIFSIALLLIVIYGLATDCPNTAGYVYCSAPERWELLY